MAATHGVSVAMLSSYIPAQPVPGLGRLSGTAWALTDLLLGEGCWLMWTARVKSVGRQHSMLSMTAATVVHAIMC